MRLPYDYPMEFSGILIEKWYKEQYGTVNASASGGFFQKFMHRKMESGLRANHNCNILEIGGNLGEHAAFVKAPWASYILTDIRNISEPEINRLKNLNIDFQVQDVSKLDFESHIFDRVIITCVFHHLINIENAITELIRVSKPNGLITILLPCDPGLIYRILRRLTSVRKAKKFGVKKELELVHAFEHRNHFLSIRTIFNHYFADSEVKVKYYPFYFKSFNLNAFAVFNIKIK